MWKYTHPAKQKGHCDQKDLFTLSAEPTIKVAAKDKMCDFYFQNKDLDIIAHKPDCPHLCYKSFPHGYYCSFLKTSPMMNFENAFNYPLSTIPLSLSNANGSVRKTSKKKLAYILMSELNEENTDDSKGKTEYIDDLKTLIRLMTAILETLEDLSLNLISVLP